MRKLLFTGVFWENRDSRDEMDKIVGKKNHNHLKGAGFVETLDV